MINQSKYVPRQMNGPIINAFFQACEEEFYSGKEIVEYLYSLSLATADESDLESIGCIIGYPRPLVPEGFDAENIMILGSLPLETDAMIGLSTVGSELGGQLSTTDVSDTGYMSVGLYRKMLEKVAILKRYGITLKSVSDIAALISPNFTIGWDEYGDIEVNYTESIGYKNVWILSQLFYRICTEPQVIITTGE